MSEMSRFIIAEIGINHNGSVDLAKQLIDVAAERGCDAVKFQKRTVEELYGQEYLDSPRESPWGTTQREQKEGLELSWEAYEEIDAHCKARNIQWSASAWDPQSLEFIESFDVPFHKVASAMAVHQPLVEAIAALKKPTYVSTGMSTWEQLDAVVEIFEKAGTPITLMHTVSLYPMPDEQANLRMIDTLRERYGHPVGYSGHELGIEISTAAVAMGASAVERHITLDRAMYGSDQAASLEPRGLELLVRNIRTVEKAMGSGERRMAPGEEEVEAKLRGHIRPEDWILRPTTV